MKPLVTDELWEHVQPLLPPPPRCRFRSPGRKPLDYREVLTGILLVLKTGIAGDDLPAALGCGCGKTCRHYLQVWHQAGVWQRWHALWPAELNRADRSDQVVPLGQDQIGLERPGVADEHRAERAWWRSARSAASPAVAGSIPSGRASRRSPGRCAGRGP